MANRDFSLIDYFNKCGQNVRPLLSFHGKTYGEWKGWKKRFKEKLIELLGDFPKQVPINVETIWRIEEEGIVKQKIIIDTEEFASMPVIVMWSTNIDMNKKHKALLCIHGHSTYGKDSVAGFKLTEDRMKEINEANYDFASQFTKQEYITLSPDLRGFAERSDQSDPYPGRDKCNVHFIRGLLMGIPLITLHLWDLKVVLNYMDTLSFIDSKRIGCIGLSLGGTLAMHLSAIDDRIKATNIICAVTTYQKYAINMGNFCGSQFIPHIYKYGDIKDIAGLISPRPLLVESGVHDEGFPIEASLYTISEIGKIYEAAGVKENFMVDVFEGTHQFSGRKAFAFFKEHL